MADQEVPHAPSHVRNGSVVTVPSTTHCQWPLPDRVVLPFQSHGPFKGTVGLPSGESHGMVMPGNRTKKRRQTQKGFAA